MFYVHSVVLFNYMDLGSDVDPDWLYPDPDPQNLINPEPDPEPDPG